MNRIAAILSGRALRAPWRPTIAERATIAPQRLPEPVAVHPLELLAADPAPCDPARVARAEALLSRAFGEDDGLGDAEHDYRWGHGRASSRAS